MNMAMGANSISYSASTGESTRLLILARFGDVRDASSSFRRAGTIGIPVGLAVFSRDAADARVRRRSIGYIAFATKSLLTMLTAMFVVCVVAKNTGSFSLLIISRAAVLPRVDLLAPPETFCTCR